MNGVHIYIAENAVGVAEAIEDVEDSGDLEEPYVILFLEPKSMRVKLASSTEIIAEVHHV